MTRPQPFKLGDPRIHESEVPPLEEKGIHDPCPRQVQAHRVINCLESEVGLLEMAARLDWRERQPGHALPVTEPRAVRETRLQKDVHHCASVWWRPAKSKAGALRSTKLESACQFPAAWYKGMLRQ